MGDEQHITDLKGVTLVAFGLALIAQDGLLALLSLKSWLALPFYQDNKYALSKS